MLKDAKLMPLLPHHLLLH